MARADEIWAQAWSEPEAGSDLAAIRSRAVRDRRRLAAVGQKTWSSRAAFADRRSGCSDRTGSDATPPTQRHGGLTYLLFGLRADGVTVRPIRQLGGEPGFAEIFLDDVFVPDADVIGAPGDGWRVAMSTASNERGLSLRSPGRFVAAADRLVELWRRGRRPGRHRDCATGSPTPGSGPGPTSCTPTPPPPGWPRAGRSAPRRAWARCSGPSSTSRCTRPRWTCSARAPSCRRRTLAGRLPVRPGRADLRRHQRDPAHRDRRTAAAGCPGICQLGNAIGPDLAARSRRTSGARPALRVAQPFLRSPGRAPRPPGRRAARHARRGRRGRRRPAGPPATWLPGWRCGGELAELGVTALAVPQKLGRARRQRGRPS